MSSASGGEFAEEECYDEPDDYILAGPLAEDALIVTLSAVTAYWADNERIAMAAPSAECLTYDEILRLAPGRRSLTAELSRRKVIVNQR